MAKRLKDLRAWLKAHDITVEPGGKHFIAKRPGVRNYAIPAHNGERSELDSVYIKGLMRNFGILLDPDDWERAQKKKSHPPPDTTHASHADETLPSAVARERDD